MTTHSSILAWKIPWIEESGGLQFMGLQRVRHNLATKRDPKEQKVCLSAIRVQTRERPFRLEMLKRSMTKGTASHPLPCDATASARPLRPPQMEVVYKAGKKTLLQHEDARTLRSRAAGAALFTHKRLLPVGGMADERSTGPADNPKQFLKNIPMIWTSEPSAGRGGLHGGSKGQAGLLPGTQRQCTCMQSQALLNKFLNNVLGTEKSPWHVLCGFFVKKRLVWFLHHSPTRHHHSCFADEETEAKRG